MNRHRRGELITDAQKAVEEIRIGHSLMHSTCVLAAPQLRTWPVGKLIEAVQYKQLYTVVSLNA
ncbi:MAG: hypothetical protein PHC49_18470 [Desulfuromonadaceae bacterium]|nr:hypothetical protein [Desulfuromonadaceae bacterium]